MKTPKGHKPGSQEPAKEGPLADPKMIRRLLGLVWQYRARCIWTVVAQILLLGLGLIGLSVTGLSIDAIRYRDTLGRLRLPFGLLPPVAWGAVRLIAAMGLAILVVSLVRLWLTYHSSMVSARLTQDIIIRLRAQVYNKLQRLGFRFFDSNETGSIINRVTGDVQLMRMFVDGVIIQGVILVLTLGVSLVYMLRIHPLLTLACLATTPLLGLGTFVFTRLVRPAMLRSRDLFDRMILVLAENVQGVHVVKGFGREPDQIEKFTGSSRDVRDQQGWIFRVSSLYTCSTDMMAHVNTVILIGYGGWLVTRGQLELGSGLLVFYGLLGQVSGQVSAIAGIANTVQMSLTGARRVFEVLDTPVEIRSSPRAARLPRARGAVEFRNVAFGYDPEEPVIENVSFRVEPGQCLAILGPTGSGKSTILNLIPRFYDPQRGEVRVDGMDVRKLHLDDLRRNIGFVFQETFLFSHTVAANIAFGNPEATPEQIERAARAAAAHDFIMALDKGYDTLIGERGVGLSGGQRQRIALARAVLLEPAILLLDDPTASVDPQTEAEIQEALDLVMAGRTTLLVSHRLSTLRRADRIIVLQKGRIVQAGTHEELIAVPGHYRDTAEIQFDASQGTGMTQTGT